MYSLSIYRLVSYILGSMFLAMGIIAVFGWFIPSYIPSNMRIILGIMMILWGIYRIAMTRFRAQQLQRGDEDD